MFESVGFKKDLGSDNHSGVHPKILAALSEANRKHAPSYGTDPISRLCESEFKRLLGPSARPFFVFNGTAANVLSIRALVQSYHSIICAETAHLNVDECAAPESLIGCKLLTLPTPDGKLTPEQVERCMIRAGDQHYAQPKLVSISQPTEVGTLYSIEELKALREATRRHGLYLHIDGARITNAAEALGVSLKQLTSDIGIDALSFGGTKNGLLFGEAVVFFAPEPAKDFKYIRKQNLQLPSKMRFLAAQFYAFFKDDLWRDIAAHSNQMAQALAERLTEFPEVEVMQEVQTNMIFVRIPKPWTKPLKKQAFFYVFDEHEWIMRWMTSFDTQEEDLQAFVDAIKELKHTTPVQ